MTENKQHRKPKKPLPDFKNRQAMAEWFDTHDMTEYDFKPVAVSVALEKPKEELLVVRMQKPIKDQLEQVARSKGLNISSLARMWLMEKLQSSH